MIEFFDKYGQEIDRRTWALLHEDEDYCRIGYDEVGSVMSRRSGSARATAACSRRWCSGSAPGPTVICLRPVGRRWKRPKPATKPVVAQAVAEERR